MPLNCLPVVSVRRQELCRGRRHRARLDLGQPLQPLLLLEALLLEGDQVGDVGQAGAAVLVQLLHPHLELLLHAEVVDKLRVVTHQSIF